MCTNLVTFNMYHYHFLSLDLLKSAHVRDISLIYFFLSTTFEKLKKCLSLQDLHFSFFFCDNSCREIIVKLVLVMYIFDT